MMYTLAIGTTAPFAGDFAMPDGDRVHPKLAQPYQKPYKQLCEGQFSSESLADEAVYRVKRQLQKLGDAPAQLVAQVAAHLDSIPNEPILRSLTNWATISREIDWLAASAEVPKRIGEHIVEASKAALLEMRKGAVLPQPNEQLMERTLERLYRAEFEERVPMTKHYNNVSQEFVQERLDEMRPHVRKKLAYLARQAANRTSFQRLRRAPRVKPKIDLRNTDIESLS